MNILFLNNIPLNPCYGGIERVTDIIVKSLLIFNKQYNIFYLISKVSADDISLLNYDFPAKIFELPFEGGFENQENIDYYFNFLKENNIDIIINQKGTIPMMNKILECTKNVKKISVVHSVVDYEIDTSLYRHLHWYSKTLYGYCMHIIKNMFPRLLKIYLDNRIKPQIKSHYSSLMRASDVIVVLSAKYISKMQQYIEAEKVKITAINNPNTFACSDVDFSIKKKKLLYVGRLHMPEKNPMRLLQIWRKIYSIHKDWELVIVGDGVAKEDMLAYVEKHKLPRVYFEGNRHNVVDYYKEASIICLTSNFEGWGMALTEGMTFGCVPFTFGNSGAAYDIIDDGENGCIIPAFNLKQYARSLSEVMSDDKKRFALGKAAQEKVKQFSAENIVKQWDELFHKLVEC